ncbi:hypothetical protein [uncultured Cyclobacterium sp.]|uniref:hypothetical protein n=1 Tax=uncultured Cyclobacterium sp. TaxID=453820 RepID=UPI0030EEC4DA|tara:strand:+ start:80758 stop:81111 length:354 start_codon:yes stop_codon:yes gene_type:complete
MRKLKEIKMSLTLLLSGAVLIWSFLLPFSPTQGFNTSDEREASVKSLGYVDFFALPSVYEEGNAFKNFLIEGLFAGIKNQEFSWNPTPCFSVKSFIPHNWVLYHYLKQILFPFHFFW